MPPIPSTTVPLDRSREIDKPGWKQQMREAVTDVDELLTLLSLPTTGIAADRCNRFRLRVPRAYIAKMHPGDPHDPLLRQVLPSIRERSDAGMLDPVGDLDAMRSPGLLQKYHGRALLITTGACAVHCRYCFRRHYPYPEAGCLHSMDDIVNTLQHMPDVDEIILSGGDPLMLDDDRLRAMLSELRKAERLRYLRIHTRLPVVLPARITAALLALLRDCGLRVTMVIHANHANEIAATEADALSRLHAAGVTLLNQSVLLDGVNDDAETLASLSRRLHDHRVLPYYLHLLDPVRGAMHFDVDENRARGIVSELRARLPGFLVPTLVREVPDSPSKTTISVI